jgi:class 3 adenylate cyclase
MGSLLDKFIGDALVIFFGDPETNLTVSRFCLTVSR